MGISKEDSEHVDRLADILGSSDTFPHEVERLPQPAQDQPQRYALSLKRPGSIWHHRRCSVRPKRTGVAEYRFGARLYSEIAQPLGVPFACSRKTDDGSRDCIARRIDYAPVMEGLDGKFECDAQETRGLWIRTSPHQDIV